MFPMSCSYDGMKDHMCVCIVVVAFGGIYVV